MSVRLAALAIISVFLGLTVGQVLSPSLAKAAVLSVGGPMVSGQQTREGLEKAAEGFVQQHPGVEVQFLPSTAEALKVAIVSGAPPDVVFVDGPYVSSWAVSGLIVPLTAYIHRDGVSRGDFIPPTWRQTEWNGEVWAMSVIVDPNFALLYNMDLYDAAGLDANNPPETIPQFEEVFRALTRYNADGVMAQIGMVPWEVFGYGNTMYTWGWIFGGRFFDYETNAVTANDPRNVRALDWLRRYYEQYVGGVGELSRRVAQGDRFTNGFEAMVFSHTGRVKSVKDTVPDLRFGIAAMPYDPAEGSPNPTWVGGWTLAIPAGAANPDLAWEFIKYVTATPEGTEAFAITSGWFPSYIPSPAFQIFLDDPVMGPFVDIIVKAKNQRPVIPVQELYVSEMEAALTDVFAGRVPPVEALARVASRVQLEFDRVMNEAKGPLP